MKPGLIILIAVIIIFMVMPNFKFHPLVGLVLLIGIGWLLAFIFSNIDDKGKEG